MENVDVEKIMDGIRATVPDQEERWKSIRFSDIPIDTFADLGGGGSGAFEADELEESVRRTVEHSTVPFFHPLEGAPYTIPAKKVVRKLIRACIEPICRTVSVFQEAASRALCQLLKFVHTQRNENTALQDEISALRLQVKELEQRLEQLEKASK